jgi:hypothetical protein
VKSGDETVTQLKKFIEDLMAHGAMEATSSSKPEQTKFTQSISVEALQGQAASRKEKPDREKRNASPSIRHGTLFMMKRRGALG